LIIQRKTNQFSGISGQMKGCYFIFSNKPADGIKNWGKKVALFSKKLSIP
jgi:hypothetical protein